MNTLVSAWLLTVTSSAVLGASLESRESSGPFSLLTRETRNADLFRDCISIPHLEMFKMSFRDSLDHDDDGKASLEDIKNYLKRYKETVKDETAAAFLAARDLNDDGFIDFVPEYIQIMVAGEYGTERAREWFTLQDTDDDGFVSRDELIRQGQAQGWPSEKVMDTVMGYYMVLDANNDQKLDFDEFKQTYMQRGAQSRGA